VFQLVPIASGPLSTTEKSLALTPLHAPFRYLYALMRSSLRLLFSRLNSVNFTILFYNIKLRNVIKAFTECKANGF